MNPLVSIILPTYNGAQTLSQAIESITAQTYHEWELIILSDGSTDDTARIVEPFSKIDPRIVFIANEKNLGIQKTLNKGIGMARGAYIARIDDDDKWVDQSKLSIQIAFLENNPTYVLLGTDATVSNENGIILSSNVMPKTDEEIRSKMLSKNCFLHSTIVIRKQTLDMVGGYSEKKETLHAEDYDLWLRAGLQGKMANIGMQSTILTAHSNSLTARNRSLQAQNILRSMLKHRKEYPHFLKGYVISVARLMFFYGMNIVPIPPSLWYRIQRAYRSV